VVTALRFYGCERSMVISNSTYSNVAQQLADSNDCVLINRSELLQMIG
jgi:HJR/Mrr/RecB family endonuclease